MAVKYCSFCGAILPRGAKKCDACGASIQDIKSRRKEYTRAEKTGVVSSDISRKTPVSPAERADKIQPYAANPNTDIPTVSEPNPNTNSEQKQFKAFALSGLSNGLRGIPLSIIIGITAMISSFFLTFITSLLAIAGLVVAEIETRAGKDARAARFICIVSYVIMIVRAFLF